MEHLIDAIYMWLMAEILRENIFYSFLWESFVWAVMDVRLGVQIWKKKVQWNFWKEI